MTVPCSAGRFGRGTGRPAVRIGVILWLAVASLASQLARAAEPKTGPGGGPMAATRAVLERTHTIVAAPGDRNQKLNELKNVLRDFLDTDALGRKAMGKHLEGKSASETNEFLRLFRELFIRTYVQRLLLFEVPDFAYGEEKVNGDHATVHTEIVTARDRFGVDYALEKAPAGWRATDILVEDVSLAENFRSQFDKALATDSFDGLLARLKKKLESKSDSSGL
jgi:phospholipid transport system substrate-binding protein